jgi:exonuclease V gamma subunit
VKSGKLAELMTELKQEMQNFTKHTYEAMWQHRCYVLAKETLEPGNVLEVLDFAENYWTFFQEEIQSLH